MTRLALFPRATLFRLTGALIMLAMMAGCMGNDDFVPLETLQKLEGQWVESNGKATLRFYPDETVKLIMPATTPPTRLLSQLELMRDGTLAFDTGDRWRGPIRIIPSDDWKTLHLHFPDEKKRDVEHIIDFVRPRH